MIDMAEYKGLSKLYMKTYTVESIPMSDEDYYEQIRNQKKFGRRQVIINEDMMVAIMIRFFIEKGYEIVEFVPIYEREIQQVPRILKNITLDRAYFYTLLDFIKDCGVSSVSYRKGEDIMTVKANGVHTEAHGEEIRSIVEKEFNTPYPIC